MRTLFARLLFSVGILGSCCFGGSRGFGEGESRLVSQTANVSSEISSEISSEAAPEFSFETFPTSILLTENGEPIWRYVYAIVDHENVPNDDPRRRAGCYVHPLYGANGEILTDDAPNDHFHHHGIFWTWPHVVVHDSETESRHFDLWTGDTPIRQYFVRFNERTADSNEAVLDVENVWIVGDVSQIAALANERIAVSTTTSDGLTPTEAETATESPTATANVAATEAEAESPTATANVAATETEANPPIAAATESATKTVGDESDDDESDDELAAFQGKGELVMKENVRIRTYPTKPIAGVPGRFVDFEFRWTTLDKPISLRGAENKSYGGFSIRFRPRKTVGKDVWITTPEGIASNDLPEKPLPWADLTSFFSKPSRNASDPADDEICGGATIIVSKDHPDFPPTWLTRYYGPLCVGWPGVEARTFRPGETFELKYRVWIHQDRVSVEQIRQVADDYWNR